MLRSLVVAIAAIACQGTCSAQVFGPFDPPFGYYYWTGFVHDETIGWYSGNGALDDWDNWIGRYSSVSSMSGVTTIRHPAEDGDYFRIDHRRRPGEFLTNYITGGSLAFPNSSVTMENHAVVTGTSFNVRDFYATTHETPEGPTHGALTFIGSTIAAETVLIDSRSSVVDIQSGSRVTSPYVSLGGYFEPAAPPDEESGVINFSLAQLEALELVVRGRGFQLNFTNSTVNGLGINLGQSGLPDDEGYSSDLTLRNSQVSLSQYLIVGYDDIARVEVRDGSTIHAGQAYIDIGNENFGAVHVADGSEVRFRDINVGAGYQGDFSVDSDGKVFAEHTVVGRNEAIDGTMNIQDGGRWETQDFTAGLAGNAYVYVRDGGTLKIKGEGVLGDEEASNGFLSLIGPTAKLELENGIFEGTLTIGRQGTGVLSLEQGATFTSEGSVNLGDTYQRSAGIVFVDGPDSKWTVNGDLVIGKGAIGAVEVRNGGALETTGAGGIRIGVEQHGVGKLTLEGPDNPITFHGPLTLGESGNGALELSKTLRFELASLYTAQEVESASQIMIKDSAMFKATGAFTLGVKGTANLRLESGGMLETSGTVIVADQDTSAADVSITGEGSQWTLTGGSLSLGKKNDASLTIESQGRFVAQSGSSVVLGEELGFAAIATVDVTGAGSVFQAQGNLTVGKDGTGVITATAGGKLDLPGGLILGDLPDSNGTIEVQPTGMLELSQGTVFLGKQGDGAFKIGGGTTAAPVTRFEVGSIGGGWGLLELSGAANLTAGEVKVGSATGGRGTLNLFGTSQFTLSSLKIGLSGTATVEDGGRLKVNSADGLELTGTLNINQGGQVLVPNGRLTATGGMGLHTITIFGEKNGLPSMLSAEAVDAGASRLDILVTDGGAITAVQELVLRNSALSILGMGTQRSIINAGRVDIGLDGSINTVVVATGATFRTRGPNGAFRLGSNSVLLVTDATSLVQVKGPLTVSGGIVIDTGAYVAAQQVQLTQRGTISLSGGAMVIGGDLDALPSIPANTVLVRPGGRLQGKSGLISAPSITGKVIVQGDLVIGASPGLLAVDGDVTVEAGGTVQIEIGGLTPEIDYDVLHATGTTTIDGTVVLSFTGGFAPDIGDTFNLVNATTLAGSPDFYIKNLAPGWQYQFVQQAGDWMLESLSNAVAITPGDYNFDGTVDLADFSKWKLEFGATGQNDADGNGDMLVDAADYTVWRDHLQSSLPSTSVPEPGAIALAIAVMLACVPQRRGTRDRSHGQQGG